MKISNNKETYFQLSISRCATIHSRYKINLSADYKAVSILHVFACIFRESVKKAGRDFL